ncbi:universal stress protein [Tetragenococcus koreensis]|uniref:Universal stress protein n=1 Tax=Tetragenococcus koreensis TaxID=290335 RepID=A0AAN4ZT48_9ENTE|nr:universal stress protein [Tetragenococcus koreensis]AYW44572.1 universal stress protein [Tetragenococcus koreensis]MCF1584540.1 universal stress protein [Tetragenococcus koreensis]MCF1614089.1 universal stress protein [Tetragenococcus koreensis]MCF1619302.1 universal stress protein [Tetragenococcus koreensis]MCF1623867.1 universal stress protein [Tetragenococcus koreensis]
MAEAYKNILVAIDGSDKSEKAFKEAIEIAKRNDATVFLTWIINDVELTTSAYAFSRLLKDEQQNIEEDMDDKVKAAEQEGIKKIERIVEIGSPKEMLGMDIPKEHGIDLIVMGSTGKGAIAQALVGSTTSFVVNHAPCNVMVVK